MNERRRREMESLRRRESKMMNELQDSRSETGMSSVGVKPLIVNGEPVDGSDYPWMVSFRKVYPRYIDETKCNWIPSSSNVNGKEFIGWTMSREECVPMVREHCPSADIVSVHFEESGE